MIRLNKNEKVLLFTRRHWLILALELMVLGISLIGFLILLSLVLKFGSRYVVDGVTTLVVFISIIFIQIIWTIFFLVLMDYWLDTWIVTNERIIDIEQKGLFNREFSEFKLSRVQDVTVDVKGILATIFRFGNVQVQTAGERRQFIFEDVPFPHKIKNKILAAYDVYVNKQKSLARAAAEKQNPLI